MSNNRPQTDAQRQFDSAERDLARYAETLAETGSIQPGLIEDARRRKNAAYLELTAPARYEAFGRWVAALLGSFEEWSGADMLEDIASEASRKGFVVSDQTAEQLAEWREIAEGLGIEHDGPEDHEPELVEDDDDDDDEALA